MLYYCYFQEKTIYYRCFYSARKMELVMYKCHKHKILSKVDCVGHVSTDSLLFQDLESKPHYRSQS